MPGPLDILALSRSVRAGIRPIHGVRLEPGPGTTGWFFWAGERSPRHQEFDPTCVAHACAVAPEIADFLELAPGYRVRIGPDGYAWRDARLTEARIDPCAKFPASSRAP